MPDPAQFAFPLQLVNGTFLTRPQGSNQELADRVSVLVRTPPGWLDGDEQNERAGLGLADQRFRKGGADMTAVDSQILTYVPEAITMITEDPSRLDAALEYISVQVGAR